MRKIPPSLGILSCRLRVATAFGPCYSKNSRNLSDEGFASVVYERRMVRVLALGRVSGVSPRA
jgi:hypothetical protein